MRWVDPAQPIDWRHPLTRGLVSWRLALPNAVGYQTTNWRDLTKRIDGAFTGTPTWDGAEGRPGGYGCLRTTSANKILPTAVNRWDSLTGITSVGWFRHEAVVDATQH